MGRLILITGGARSGKSTHAEWRAAELGGDDVTFIATAEPLDEEMQRRISRHRAERPATWRTVEAPLGAGIAIASARTAVVLLDCVTLLASNVMLALDEADEDILLRAVAEELEAVRDASIAREGVTIAVTNEVGMGIVPPTPLGRCYRDGLGRANQVLAGAADEVVLLVSGIPIRIK